MHLGKDKTLDGGQVVSAIGQRRKHHTDLLGNSLDSYMSRFVI